MNKKAIVISCLEPEYLDYSIKSLLNSMNQKDIFVLNNGKNEKSKQFIKRKIEIFGVNELLPPNTHGNVTNIIWAMCFLANKFPSCLLIKIDEDIIWPKISYDFSKLKKKYVYIPNININNYTTKFFIDNFKNIPENIRKISKNWDNYDGWVWHKSKKEKELAKFMYSKTYKDYEEIINSSKKQLSVVDYNNHMWPLMEERGISSTAFAMWSSTILKLFNKKKGVEEVLIANSVKENKLKYLINWKDLAIHINYYSIRPWVKENFKNIVEPFLKGIQNERL